MVELFNDVQIAVGFVFVANTCLSERMIPLMPRAKQGRKNVLQSEPSALPFVWYVSKHTEHTGELLTQIPAFLRRWSNVPPLDHTAAASVHIPGSGKWLREICDRSIVGAVTV